MLYHSPGVRRTLCIWKVDLLRGGGFKCQLIRCVFKGQRCVLPSAFSTIFFFFFNSRLHACKKASDWDVYVSHLSPLYMYNIYMHIYTTYASHPIHPVAAAYRVIHFPPRMPPAQSAIGSGVALVPSFCYPFFYTACLVLHDVC